MHACQGQLKGLFTAQKGQPEGQYGLQYSLQSRDQSSRPDIGRICQGNRAHRVIQTTDILCT